MPLQKRSLRFFGHGTLLLVSLLVSMLMSSGTASAEFVIVECGGNTDTSLDTKVFGDLQSAINYLHDDPELNHIIEVTGECSFLGGTDGNGNQIWNSFTVSDFVNLTIRAPLGETATLSQPVVTCDQTPLEAEVNIRGVLVISDSRFVRLLRLTIDGGQGVGVNDSRVEFRGGVVVMNSRGGGVGVGGEAGSFLSLSNPNDGPSPGSPQEPNEVGNSCGDGINVADTSSASVGGESRIHDNEGFGIFTTNSGRINLGGLSIVEGNRLGGMALAFAARGGVGGQAIIRNNGNNTDTTHPRYRFRSGINAYFGSNLTITGPRPDPVTGVPIPGPTIENNTGPGVLVDVNSNVLLRNARIQENSGGGLELIHQSVAEFEPEDTILSGNTGGDIHCDSSSLAFGDLSGVGINQCGGSNQGGPGGGGPGGGGPGGP